MATITSANSVFTLMLTDLFPVPQVLQGYATDDAFASEAVDSAEVMMGVDGKMSAGFTPFPTPMTIALQADSPSLSLFEAWLGSMKAAKEVFFADGTIVLPAINRSYVLTRGVLNKSAQYPGAKKVLQPVQFTITWESINPAVL